MLFPDLVYADVISSMLAHMAGLDAMWGFMIVAYGVTWIWSIVVDRLLS